MSNDKIFGNTFNESAFDGRSVSWKADSTWNNNIDEYSKITDELLFNEIHELIKDTKFAKLNEPNKDGKFKNLTKSEINKVFNYITGEIKNHSVIEIFIQISEYFDIKYYKFYNSLSAKSQNSILEELSKRNIRANKILNDKLF